MTTYSIGNLATGRELVSFSVMSGPWSDSLHVAETMSVKLDMNDPDIQGLGLWSSATPAQSFLMVEENGSVVAAGPIWTRSYDRDARQLTLNAQGLASYFDHRLILPAIAAAYDVTQWQVPDPSDATQTIANPALSTVLAGVSWGTIAKRLVQQAIAWTGGSVPVVFQGDEGGTDTITYLGSDFKPVWEALNDILNRQDGVEINFLPQRTSDGKGVQWLLETGTLAQPLITSSSVLAWDVTVPESAVDNLVTNEDASTQASIAWFTGGAQSNNVLVSRSTDQTLLTEGFPLLELLDSSHTDVSIQATLDGYSMQAVLAGRLPQSVWSFKVKAYAKDQHGNKSAPWVGDYAVGDFFDLHLAAWNPLTGEGDPYIPGGDYTMRVIGISGDELGEDITITCAPLVNW